MKRICLQKVVSGRNDIPRFCEHRSQKYGGCPQNPVLGRVAWTHQVRLGIYRKHLQTAPWLQNLLGETCSLVPIPKTNLLVLEDTVIPRSTKTPGPTALSVCGSKWLWGAEIWGTVKLQMPFHLLKMSMARAYCVSNQQANSGRGFTVKAAGTSQALRPVLRFLAGLKLFNSSAHQLFCLWNTFDDTWSLWFY